MRRLIGVFFIMFLAVGAMPFHQRGIASFYCGHKVAMGYRMDCHALTAAHRYLPFGSKVTVINTRNKKSVVVTINDRGPYIRGRIIDLTPAGARALGIRGIAPVVIGIGGL